MKIELTAKEFVILKDLVDLAKGIDGQTQIKYDCRTDGWHGKGGITFNRHEHDGKLRFFIDEEVK